MAKTWPVCGAVSPAINTALTQIEHTVAQVWQQQAILGIA